MEREYSYAELCRMTKKRVIRIAGFKNMKELVAKGFNQEVTGYDHAARKPLYTTMNASKKYIARIIASDR